MQDFAEEKKEELLEKMKFPNPLGLDSLIVTYTPLGGGIVNGRRLSADDAPDVVELTSTTKNYDDITLRCPDNGARYGIYVRSAVLTQQPGPCTYDATVRLRFPCAPGVTACTVNYRR
jgi:hypothetical protein